MSLLLRFFLTLNLFFFLTGMLACLPAQAYEFANAYYPVNLDQVVHKRSLYHAAPSKLDLNEADFNQLLLLPDMTPNLALKLIRLRPFADYSALQQLQGQVPKGELARLISTLERRTVLKAPSVDVPVSGLRQ